VTVRQLRPTPGAEASAAPASARAAVVEIGDFEDVESVGARYRTGQPVVFDASAADPSTARRVVDFVSGMTYVSRGSLSKVGSRAFLLIPDGVQLPDDERRRLAGLGYRVTGSDA
jgi:cell division inhibitor SepF